METKRYCCDIEIRPRGSTKRVVLIRCQQVNASDSEIAVLSRLCDEALCAVLGHKGVTEKEKHILRQYIAQLRRILRDHKASCVIAAADCLGYALCQTRSGSGVRHG
jgi:DNA-binding winged helix-turn-helix (wHTH) protein